MSHVQRLVTFVALYLFWIGVSIRLFTAGGASKVSIGLVHKKGFEKMRKRLNKKCAVSPPKT